VTGEPSLSLVDSHCHLNFDEFDQDRDRVIQQALEAGIAWFVVPGIDLDTSKSAVEYAHQYPQVFAAVGVHPNSGLSWNDGTLADLRELARERGIVALGEIGLDYYRDQCPKEIQKQIFSAQLELAGELELPVIVHIRDSAEDIMAMLVTWQKELEVRKSLLASHPGVVHSFSGDASVANTLLMHHYKLGIAGSVTYQNSKHLQEVIRLLPLEAFLIETDAPYQTPHPFRGKRNEPTNVRIVAEKIAEIKEIKVEQVAQGTTREATTLFRLRGFH
jgi:TatD DNase family protein